MSKYCDDPNLTQTNTFQFTSPHYRELLQLSWKSNTGIFVGCEQK